jgi:hypothetical protein
LRSVGDLRPVRKLEVPASREFGSRQIRGVARPSNLEVVELLNSEVRAAMDSEQTLPAGADPARLQARIGEKKTRAIQRARGQ